MATDRRSVTLITGTSTGIGLAAAVYFAERGHDVIATMRRPENCGELGDAAKAAGVSIDVRQLDVDDPSSIERCVGGVLGDHGRIDVLINNAGIGLFNPWEEASMATIEEHFTTNFFGSVRCAKAVIPTMRAQRSGAIVNVTSVAARIGAPVQGPYSATKAALQSFSESLAVELRPFGIRVANVMPGFTATPILDKAWAARTPTEGDPYGPIVGRWGAVYAQAKTVAVEPRAVAEVIEQAIGSDDRIHWFSGPDAQPLMNGFNALGDSGWLRYGDTQTDEEWFTRFATDFPMG